MGVDVVHPVDMHHTDNPPVSAALLRVLSEELVACDYDLWEFLRQITRSQAYQRSAIVPQFEKCEGPPGGLQVIDAQMAELNAEQQRLEPQTTILNVELQAAAKRLQRAQEDVDRLQQGVVGNSNNQIEDQRSRIVALANRRLALGEFVVEARGVQRSVRNRMQAVIDLQADHEQQKRRMAEVRNWLDLRSQVQQLPPNTDEAARPELKLRFDLQQTELLESFRRSFALRRVRGLSPEQLAGATYTALEMDRSIRAKALADWEAGSQVSPADRDDEKKRQAFVSAALANNMWDTVEDPIVTRFSAPAGFNVGHYGLKHAADQCKFGSGDVLSQSRIPIERRSIT